MLTFTRFSILSLYIREVISRFSDFFFHSFCTLVSNGGRGKAGISVEFFQVFLDNRKNNVMGGKSTTRHPLVDVFDKNKNNYYYVI